MSLRKHPFHLVDPSPWPFVASMSALVATFGGVMYMHGYDGGEIVLPCGIAMILYSMVVWWRDVIREGTFEGFHTAAVQQGLRYGMILFIVSEKEIGWDKTLKYNGILVFESVKVKES